MAATTCMTLWTTVSPVIWLSIFILLPFLFNILNLRRYGEVEYWITVIKVFTLVSVILIGILLPMGASTSTQLLGTDAQFSPVKCGSNTVGQCLSPPGFTCILLTRKTDIRLARRFPKCRSGYRGSPDRFLGVLSSCCLFIYRMRNVVGFSIRDREAPKDHTKDGQEVTISNYSILCLCGICSWPKRVCRRPDSRTVSRPETRLLSGSFRTHGSESRHSRSPAFHHCRCDISSAVGFQRQFASGGNLFH
jgi:hypothetical protein